VKSGQYSNKVIKFAGTDGYTSQNRPGKIVGGALGLVGCGFGRRHLLQRVD
jgi:hypothetical protein